MINYTLDRDASKKFIRHYQEENDSIIILYENGESVIVENTDDIKRRLNILQTDQVYNMEQTINHDIDKLLSNPSYIRKPVIAGMVIGLGTTAAINILSNSALDIAVVPGILTITSTYFTTQFLYQRRLRAILEFNKFKLFLVYKNRINKSLKEEAKKDLVVVDENSLNPIVRPRPVKYLCVNDVNFMNYFDVLKLTREIDKKERRMKRQKEISMIHQSRCEDLGLKHDEVKILRK